MAESFDERIIQQTIRSYEISIWTLQDRFLSILKWATMNLKGQILEPEVILRDDGTEELSFTIPKFYWAGPEKLLNPMWLHLQNLPLEANMHKLKVIFNKNTEYERVFEFLVTSVASDHTQDRVDINVKAEGLAFHELGKVGYKIALSQTNFELLEEEWVKKGMHGDRPRMNIQYWNDLIFKDSNKNWRTDWRYEVRMDWSSYSLAAGFLAKDPEKVYEDEYVSSWLLDSNGKLAPRLTEGYKEKWRPVEISESNIYNATLTIAEQFGVFCRYEYEHDDNYQITGKKVIYYNNYIYDKEGHIDLTYPYSSSAITRTVDNSNITTKMFVQNVELDSQLISIIDTEANKSKEDYLLCFDYLRDILAINPEQYEELENYEVLMHLYNTVLTRIQERIRILTNLLVDLEAEYTTYTNAAALDNERYDEAVRGMNSITNGRALVDVDTNFVVMEDNENNLGLYIKMRYEGMVLNSIKLYGKSNFASLNGDLYSYPITSFLPKYDDNNNLTYLYNIQGSVGNHPLQVGDTVYLSGKRDPYTYYETLATIWANRRDSDDGKAKEAEDTISLYNWYLYGSRADYGRADSARIDEAYYGLAIIAPLDDEEALKYWFSLRPFISSYAGLSRVGDQDEDLDFTYDHFEDLDLETATADLIYFLEYYLKAKEIEYNKLERMMGPALREGYWQPDNYHDYGDSYEASFELSAKKTLLISQDNEPSSFDAFIPKSLVWATLQSNQLSPYMLIIWDCNKYYENETPLIYTSSISENKDQHLTIDISEHLNKVKDHLNDLCFFYTPLSIILTIEDIDGSICKDSSKITKKGAVLYNLAQFKNGKYTKGGAKVVGDNYYSKLVYLINKIPYSDADTSEAYSPYLEYADALSTILTAAADLANKNIYYTDLDDTNLSTLESIANTLHNLLSKYEEIIKALTSIKNANKDTSNEYKNAVNAIKFGNSRKAWIEAAYNYLMEMDTLLLADWNKLMQAIENVDDSHYYSITDRGLVIFIKLYKLYTSWLETLNSNRYTGFLINSLAELGWVIDTNPIFTEKDRVNDYGERYRIPVFIVTAANTLDENTIKFFINHTYETEKLLPDGAVNKESHIAINDDYWPFLGYYDIKKDKNGAIISMEVKRLCYIKPIEYIGTNKHDTNNYTRNLTSHDYDKNTVPRLPKAEEYRYQRVYPRLFFNTLKLKNTSSDLYINLNGNTLSSFEDYSVVTDDRSKGQKVLGVGYYVTLKPHLLFQYGDSISRFDISYVLSNADVSIYLDALKVMRENAYPKVSYDVELSVLNPEFVRTAYNRLNQIVHINDNDLQLEEVSGYISAVTLKLDKPWEDTIEIKNYETKFEDLFTTIVAQTEAMKKSSLGLDSALQAFSRTTGLIDSDVLYNSLLNVTNLNLNFNKGKLTIDLNEGIWGTSEDGVVAFRGGGIFTATLKDANGNWMWNTGILPSGINASLITTGQLDTNKIKVYAGDELRFLLNGEGLYAYKSFTSESSDIEYSDYAKEIITNIDPKQYVVFNSEGLFLTAKEGAIYATGTALNKQTGQTISTYEKLSRDVNRVEVSWRGLILRNWQNEEVFYADPNTGNLTLNGTIYAKSGSIAGWTIQNGLLSGAGKLILRSGVDSSGPAIFLSASELGKTEIFNGKIYYVYSYTLGQNTYHCYSELLLLGVNPVSNFNSALFIRENKVTGIIPKDLYIYSIIAGRDTPSTDSESESVNNIETTVTYCYLVRSLPTDGSEPDYLLDANGERIEYDHSTTIDSTWYQKLKNSLSNYQSYVTEIVQEVMSGIPAEVTEVTLVSDGATSPFIIETQNNGEQTNVALTAGYVGNFQVTPNGLAKGTINATIDTLSTFTNGNNDIKMGNCIYDLSINLQTGTVSIKHVDGTQQNFNLADLLYVKDAVSAAGKLSLTLTVSGSKVTAVAKSGLTTITKTKTVSSSSDSGGGSGGGGYSCSDNCTKQCATDCGKVCGSSCTGGCAATCKSSCKSSGGGCFIGDTLITTLRGKCRRIDQLSINDKVMAYDEATQTILPADIIVLLRLNNKTELIEIILENGEKIITSASHPFLTVNGWAAINPELALQEHQIEAISLKEGMYVYDSKKNKIAIKSINSKENINHEPLYNLCIDKYHTFLANDIIVHNVAVVTASIK